MDNTAANGQQPRPAEERPTPCQCPAPGWCQRHQCQKTPHWWRLCRTRADYFQLWEEGRGPGQHTLQPPGEPDASASGPGEPGLVRKAVNFGRETVRHIADRRRTVSEDLYQKRLAVCRDCPYCDLNRMLCRHNKCGCYLKRKAGWRSARCPLNQWPRPEAGQLAPDRSADFSPHDLLTPDC